MFKEIKREISELKTDAKTLRTFSVTMFSVSASLAVLFYFKKSDSAVWFMLFASALLFAGIYLPDKLKGLYLLWMGFAVVVGFFMSKAILIVIFYGLFFPIGVLLRIIKKKTLTQELAPALGSYWLKKDTTIADKPRYEKLF